MKPYIIWSYEYRHASSGPKALHRLCHELNRAGQTAFVSHPTTNPEWDTPYYQGSLRGDNIAIYPEVVQGNPWGAPNVVRWVLNVPGKLGGDASYPPTETVFSWDKRFLDAPLLHLPAIELDIYTDRDEPRSGELSYYGKAGTDSEITREMRQDRYALADALNHATLLRCYDDTTAMAQIALLCGCPVYVVPTDEHLEPAGFREAYIAQWPVFLEQLRTFIDVTQEMAA